MNRPAERKSRAARRRAGVRGAAAAALLLAGLAPAADDRVTRADGDVLTESVVAIGDGRLTLPRSPLALDELWHITRAAAAGSGSGGVERVILPQGELPAGRVTVAGAVCRFDWLGAPGVVLPRTAVRALVLPAGRAPAAQAALARALERPSATDQVLALGAENLPLPVPGAVAAISSNAVTMNYQGQERSIARSRVCAVVFGTNGVAAPSSAPLVWKVSLADGAWVEGANARLTNGLLTLALGAETLAMPWERVRRLEYRGPRLRFLSDLAPVAVAQQVLVTLPLPWQRNRNAMGAPLRLQGEPCDRGVGMHAPAELTFELPANARRFLARAGLDEEYGRRGDCVVSVLAGGRELFRQRLRGGDAPHTVDVDVRTAGRLVLRVEPGENLDMGDHVNWYDARLLVEP